MRLAQFIVRDLEHILSQWETFAATHVSAAAGMTPLQLRDHAREILQAVVQDLETSQTKEAQVAKSKGLAPKPFEAPETSAETHGFLRACSGFDIKQLTSEFRALRASVMRLWMDACQPDAPHLEDIIRFNEAIDQALAESIAFFSAHVDQSRNLFLGMLGHDMRSPLMTITNTAAYLARLNSGAEISKAASRLISGGKQMHALLDDLVDFNRTTLGVGILVHPTPVDLASIFAVEVEALRAIYPERQLDLEVTGDVRGRWDGLRLQRVLGNLVVNAIKYGVPHLPVHVTVTGEENYVRFEVRNAGPSIDQSTLNQMFEPLQRGPSLESRAQVDDGLGLGLFIVREIVKAHAGEIDARSENQEIVFTVRLPRDSAAG
jgi:signal transduction histidine kinase